MKLNLTKNKKKILWIICVALVVGSTGLGIAVYNKKQQSAYILSESIRFDTKAQAFLDVQTNLQNKLNEVEKSKDETLLTQVKEEITAFLNVISIFENDAKHATEVNTSKASVYSEMLNKAKEVQPQMLNKVLNIEKTIEDEKAIAKAKADAEAAAQAQVASDTSTESTVNNVNTGTGAEVVNSKNSGQRTTSGATTKQPAAKQPAAKQPATKQPTNNDGKFQGNPPNTKMCKQHIWMPDQWAYFDVEYPC